MSVSRMKLAAVAGPLKVFDEVALQCVAGRAFHPESAATLMSQVSGLRPFDLANPYAEPLRRTERLLALLGVKPSNAAPREDNGDYLSDLERRVDALVEEREERAGRVAEDEHLFTQLGVLRGINVPLEALYNVTYMKFRFGRLPRDIFQHFYPLIKDRPDVFFFITDTQKETVYGMYMTPRAGAEKVDALFASLQFDRIRLSERLTGSSGEAEAAIRLDLAQNKARIEAITAELSDLARCERDALSALCHHLRHRSAAFETRRYAARSEESFFLLGWVPVREYDEFERSLERFEDVNCVPADDGSGTLTPPTKLQNNRIVAAFEPLVTMYGLPAYHEFDPTPLVALTYPILFGIMFGDLGQAALLLLVGLLMWKRKGMWLGKVLCYCAAGSALFGAVYGSVFGAEDLLPGFKVLHSSDSLFAILRVTVYAGAALVALSMVLNILNGLRQRDWEKVLFGPASVCGLALYTGVVFTVLPFLGFGTSPLPPPVLGVLLVLPTVVIFCKEPLVQRFEGKAVRLEEGVGGFLMVSFFEMFDVLLSFVTNSISFLRIGAYAISHASLMTVVFDLAASPGGSYNIVVLVLGNLIVVGLEAVLVAIQVLRLEYYEIFGRFFAGSGRPYAPLDGGTP